MRTWLHAHTFAKRLGTPQRDLAARALRIAAAGGGGVAVLMVAAGLLTRLG